MHCFAAARLQRPCWTRAATTCSRSKRTKVSSLLRSKAAWAAVASAIRPRSFRKKRTTAASGDGLRSCTTTASPRRTNFQVLSLSPKSRPGVDTKDALQTSPSSDTSFFPNISEPRGFSKSPGPTGPSRTRCTGSSMSSLPRMPTAQERTTHPRTSLSCEGSRSTSFEHTQIKSPCAAKSKPQPGTTTSCSAFSAKSDSPALEGEGRERSERGGVSFPYLHKSSPHPGSHLATLDVSPTLPLQGRVKRVRCGSNYSHAGGSLIPKVGTPEHLEPG